MPPLRDVIVLGVVLLSLPVCFFRPFYGIGLWTVLAFLNPHRMAWGVSRDFPVSQFVGVATVAGFLIFERRIANFWRRESALILLLWAWFAIDTVVTTQIDAFQGHAAETWERFRVVSKILLMTLVSIGIVNDWFRLRRFLLCIAAAFGLLIAKLLPWMILTGGSFRAYGPEGTMIADNNDLGLALVMVFPIFFFLAKSESSRALRNLFWCLTVATVPAIFYTWSRGAFVGFLAVAGFILLGSRQKLLLAPVLLFGVVLGLFFTPEAWRDRMTGVVTESADRSVQGRYNAWRFAWNLALDYPITGGGFGAFTPGLFRQYAPNARDYHASHSIYFGTLGEQGFVGLGLYLGLFVSCFATLRELKRHGNGAQGPPIALYASMLQTSLVGFCVSGAFLGRHYFDLFFDIVACVVMLKAAAEQELVDAGTAPADADWERDEIELRAAEWKGVRGA